MPKKIMSRMLAIVTILIAVGIAGCSGVSEEQMTELEALRTEVKTLDGEVNSLKSQKAILEKEIADKNARLNECAKLKSETQKNLGKLGQ